MKEIIKLITVLTVISAVSGFMMAFVYAVTKEPIAKAVYDDKIKAVNEVLPPSGETHPLVLTQKQEVASFFVGRNTDGTITGVAAEGKSVNGYGGDIKVMVGISTTGTVNGIKVLRPLFETPGLGANIERDNWTAQFRGKPIDCSWAVKKDEKTNPHAIDAITAATISSRAVVEAVDAAISEYTKFKPMILAPQGGAQ